MPPRPSDIDAAAVVAGWVAGDRDPVIARRLGVSVWNVCRCRKRLGLPGIPHDEPTAEQVEATIREQLAKGRPKWWGRENSRSTIFERYERGESY